MLIYDLRGVEVLPSIQCVCILVCRIISRIDSIIRFVTLAGRRQGGDFSFGAGSGTFFLNVTDCAQNQSGEDDDNRG